tara:strand:- start:156 stop:299 length:144 start_codon:yes stop_codon:yes gene_type:complete
MPDKIPNAFSFAINRFLFSQIVNIKQNFFTLNKDKKKTAKLGSLQFI